MTLDVRLGPLSFPAPVGGVSESVGNAVDAVGQVLVQAERRPRTLKFPLAIRGDDGTPRAEGEQLRRKVRQLLNNDRMRAQGFYLAWSVDPELNAWVMIGSGDLGEGGRGITFGEWQLELGDLFVAGRPGTHRPGRRAAIADLRSASVPRDTRRLLYSEDFAAWPLASQPLYLPGDTAGVVTSAYMPGGESTQSAVRDGRHLWRAIAARDAEVLTYLPDPAVLSGPTAYLDLDEPGAVRAWDTTAGIPAGYTTAGDTEPDCPSGYAWERVLGAVGPSTPLAVENGICRLVWLGASQGLALETWDTAAKAFARVGQLLHAAGVGECRIIELTGERAVIEWRAGRYALRAVLQRGWTGPRVESYDDGGSTARLEFKPVGTGGLEDVALAPAWVRHLQMSAGGREVLWAATAADEGIGGGAALFAEPVHVRVRLRVLVAHLSFADWSSEELASRSLVDARPVPVLIGRS
jgi:hypothetical protein